MVLQLLPTISTELMKKTILILTIFISSLSYSQNFGFHFGFNSSTQLDKDKVQNNSKELNYKSVYGLNIGFDYKTNLSESLFFLTGISFYQNGFENDELMYPGGRYLAKEAKLNYLKLPLNLLLESQNTKIGPNLKFGGYISYLIGGEYNVSNYPFDTPLDNEYQNIDYGLTLGIGLKINKFTVDLDYDFGLNNVAKKIENHNINETIIRNRSFSLKLIYWLK